MTDTFENPYAFEREEWRDAQRFAPVAGSSCYRHRWAIDGRGGGVCTHCGDTVDAQEVGE